MNALPAASLSIDARAGTARTSPAPARRCYLKALAWAFALMNSVRVVSYLPTLWAICSSGDSSQHSLLTWASWFGANLTMAAWLRENNGGRMNRAALVSAMNSVMCLTTIVVVLWHRY